MKSRPFRSILTAGALLSLFCLSAPSLAQNIPRADLGKIIEYAQLSEAVYHGPFAPLPAGWAWIDGGESISGLKWALYEHQTHDGKTDWVLSFAGTEDWRDLYGDIDQSLRSGIAGTPLRFPFGIPTAQYQEALQIATKLISVKDKTRLISLIPVGHSLGGGLAQYVARMLGIGAVSFNAAALGPETIQSLPPPLQTTDSPLLIDISTSGDFVYGGTARIPGNRHFGVPYQIDPVPGTPNIMPLDAPLIASLAWKEKMADLEARHAMTNMIKALQYQQAYGAFQPKNHGAQAETIPSAAIPNWWTVASPGKHEGQLLAEARMMTDMARNAKRVVVAGDGPAADLMAQRMTEKLGAGNVVRLAGAVDSERTQRQAHQVGADLILGVRSSSSRSRVDPQTEERIAELREPFENIVAIIKTTTEALHQFNLAAKTNNKIAQWFVNPGTEHQQHVLKGADAVYGLLTAFEQDQAMASRGEFALVRSHTLEETARIGLDYLLPQMREILQKNGKAGLVFPTFGAVDGVTAVARQIGSGSVDLETLTHYLDAANSTAWGALGLVSSGGNTKIAEVYESFGSTVAKVARDTSKGWFERTWAQAHGQPLTLEAMWRTLQESNVYRNIKVQTIEQLFGQEILEQSGFSRADLARLDADAAHYEQLRLAQPRPTSQPVQQNLSAKVKDSSSSSVPNVGGIWGQVNIDNNAFGHIEGGQQ